MDKKYIKNFDDLAFNKNRQMALDIVEAGLDAIDTKKVIKNSISLNGDILSIKSESFDLSLYKNIKVIGFGKASADASSAIEEILGSRIQEGAVVGLKKIELKYIEVFEGTHPRPTKQNVLAGERIYEIAKNSNEEDLIIVIVSGGGSALLCYSQNECDQSALLYDEFLKAGQKINEMNIVRKHLSVLKGGGLAKIAYPATVACLIFSDVPGDNFANVASGSTYKDESTISDAKEIIDKYNLGKFDLLETPKEDKYFEKVSNFVLVSNKTAIMAMEKKAKDFGLSVDVLSTEMYEETGLALEKIFKNKKEGTVVLSAGEPTLRVTKKGGSGGRNLYMGLLAIKMKLIDEDSVFLSVASDGMDNCDMAGAVIDINTINKIEKLNLDVDDYLDRYDSYPIFEKSECLIKTGPTGANVSDLMVLLTKKND